MAKTASLNIRIDTETNEPRQPKYNAETEAAIRECEEMLASGNFVTYGSAREMHEAILAEDDADALLRDAAEIATAIADGTATIHATHDDLFASWSNENV
jgi:hypothetical protein